MWHSTLKTAGVTSNELSSQFIDSNARRSHKHYEAVFVRRLPLVPHHLLVRSAHGTVAAAAAAQAGMQLAEVRLPATEAHAAAEPSDKELLPIADKFVLSWNTENGRLCEDQDRNTTSKCTASSSVSSDVLHRWQASPRYPWQPTRPVLCTSHPVAPMQSL